MIRELVKQSAISLPFASVRPALPETLAEETAKNRIQRDFQIEQFEVKAIVGDELPIMSSVQQYLGPYGYERFGFDGQSLSSALRDTLNVFFVPQAGKARAWCVGGHG